MTPKQNLVLLHFFYLQDLATDKPWDLSDLQQKKSSNDVQEKVT